MNKFFSVVFCLGLSLFGLDVLAAKGMSAKQQEACRKACAERGDKMDPTCAASSKGCTCDTGDGSYTITDPENAPGLDNEVPKDTNHRRG